jgi:hypothetical protein
MSILLGTFWIPVVASRDFDLRGSVRLVQKRFLIFCVVYVLAVVYVMPRL